MRYQVEITEPAEEMLRDLRSHGKETLRQLKEVICGLAIDPEEQTEPLRGVLSGYRSLHSGRFRVVVKISTKRVVVYVIGVEFHASGSRRDVYQLIARAIERKKFPKLP